MPFYNYKCAVCSACVEEYRKIPERDNKIVCCGEEMKRQMDAPFVIPDISAYHAVAIDKETGKRPVITSRKQHKEFLARNDYVELGNEFRPPKRDEGELSLSLSSKKMDELGLNTKGL